MSRRKRLLVLAICCMSLLIVGLDTTIVNVALPSIQKDLEASVSGLQWIIDAYTLVLASLLMLSGSIADRVGRQRVFQIGLVLFTVGSGLCSLAPNLGFLIAFRALQGIGGSMLNPVAMSIIRNVFDDPKERAQAIGPERIERATHAGAEHQATTAWRASAAGACARSGRLWRAAAL